MKNLALENPNRPTARRRVAAILTKEILQHPGSEDFLVASEHQLCRRFSVSRVTIRLALGDLEHRGLIYRRHGKGTFAHGRSTRSYQSIGILLNGPDDLKSSPLVDFIRGAQTVVASLRSALILLCTSPMDWRAETATALGCVIVLCRSLADGELNVFQKHSLPISCIPDLELTEGEGRAFELGVCTAKELFHRSISGEPMDSVT